MAFLRVALPGVQVPPSAWHRLRFREHDKERMLRVSNRLAIAGLAFAAFWAALPLSGAVGD